MKAFTTALCISLLLLSACRGGGRARGGAAPGDTLPLRHAENLTLVDHGDYTVASLRNPWDTLEALHTYILVERTKPLPADLPPGTLVRTPLERSLVYSAVHCSLADQLGAAGQIAGVCDLDYIHLPAIRQGCRSGRIADCGNSMNPDIERIIDLHPDAILLSPYEDNGGYGRIGKLQIPLIECADYMETSPLGRAEWMKFYGRLFGKQAEADSLFARVEAAYLRLKQRAARSATRLTAVTEMLTGPAWYVPGGRSTTGRLFRDAGGDYAFASMPHSGAVPLAFEAVFDKAGEADVWLIKYNSPHDMTYPRLRAEHAGYAAFKAFRRRNVYGCNTARVPFYEETPFRPDLLLSDFIQILHPDIQDLGGLRYFCKLEP